jgi:membrane protein DedA with SNARE-associated domain
MALTEFLVEHIINLIETGGYPIIAFLMALESMITPVPSEAVMPFAGFLVHEGKFSFELVVLFATIGSLIGSFISYYAGAYGGKPFVKRFGKYFFLDIHDLELTEKFFKKYGDGTVFVSRFIPVVRHLISIPAGVGRMNPYKFFVYTLLGAAAWNAILTYVGYVMKDRWKEILRYTEVLDMLIIFAIIILVALFVYKHQSVSKARKP